RNAIEGILGFPMDDRTFTQASLTPKLGGLGLRRTVEHADLAFHASWHESRRTAKEEWPPPPGMQQSMCPSQKRATSPTSEYFKASLTRHLHAAKLSVFGAARSRTPTGSSLPCPQKKMGETPFSSHACSAQPLRTDWEFLC